MSNSSRITAYGPLAILVEFEPEISLEVNRKVVAIYDAIAALDLPQVSSLIPAYNSLVIKYHLPPHFEDEKNTLNKVITDASLNAAQHFKIIDVPVCYAPELALDLSEICEHKNLTEEQVITLHSAETYHVYMLGFTPGFPYLGGLNKKLAMPRKNSPRLSIPEGSVAIANEQTGIYPSSSPGGWQVIGRTPMKLFTPGKKTLFSIGDKVKFYPITMDEYLLHIKE